MGVLNLIFVLDEFRISGFITMFFRFELALAIIKIPLDFSLIVLAGLISYSFRMSPWGEAIKPVSFSLPLNEFLALLVIWAAFTVLVFAFQGLYSVKRQELTTEAMRIAVSLMATVLFITFLMVIQRAFFQSRFILIMGAVTSLVFLVLERVVLSKLVANLRKNYSIGTAKVLIIGKNQLADQIRRYFSAHPQSGYRVVRTEPEPHLEKLAVHIKNPQVNEVILTDPHVPAEKIMRLFNYCSSRAINFKFVPTELQAATAGLGLETVSGISLIELKRTRIDGWGSVVKRVFDILFAAIALTILAPLFLIIAFIIKWDSKGPVFARIRHRVGIGGREFYMYKFRSMIENADRLKEKLMHLNERERGKGPLFKLRNDPRVTRAGKFLRKYRLDELPQLINVIKGEMSVVGPRAHEPQEVEKYNEEQKPILMVKPGITGLAQISGSSDLPFDEENKLDFYYIERWSLWLDIKIILKTIVFLFIDRSAV